MVLCTGRPLVGVKPYYDKLGLAQENEYVIVDNGYAITDRNTPWPRRDTPRYAGVSSFGFSGTNAHVVLRDHTSARRPAHEVPKPRLFVLSAKSQAALGRYVDQYRTYLAGDIGASLEDICFTAARGRGHYTHRLGRQIGRASCRERV